MKSVEDTVLSWVQKMDAISSSEDKRWVKVAREKRGQLEAKEQELVEVRNHIEEVQASRDTLREFKKAKKVSPS